MATSTELKEIVKQKYSEIAQSEPSSGPVTSCGCGCSSEASVPTSCCSPATDLLEGIQMAESYQNMEGYVSGADLGLGCGLPTQFAQIKPGDVVVDLGSGAGNDCFVARAETGETGRVIGLDFTEKMVSRARQNAEALGYTNVEFVLGDIETMPLPNNLADVVVSNCVMNLVPNKRKAFEETYRILKPGGHFSVSDIVLEGDLPEGLQRDAELYAGCVSGAIQLTDYLAVVDEAGFRNIRLQKKREIHLPEDVLRNYLSEADIQAYREEGKGIFSVTVYAEK
ncbi:arsenite methyltransferase [Nibrella saemangeumensis]|uniref:Arsenite methyltransferase n=1 Tax=Nibrella saemangeumensis TaxID=1084526 RepID=A0ABP8ME51_9BACT